MRLRPITGRERALMAVAALVAVAAPIAGQELRDALAEPPGWHETGAIGWDRSRILDQDTVRIWYVGGDCPQDVSWDVYYGRRYVAINVFEPQRPGDCIHIGRGRFVDVELELEDIGDRDVIPGPLRIDP